ncbi:MAG TPA: hypothetical protein VFV38_21600 [Ktedonobacteraceae bacterium]|nr:hypothetical protein [Ktedonobacteraceae bacterium]
MKRTEKAIEVCVSTTIWIRKINPQIWRRQFVRSDCTIADSIA